VQTEKLHIICLSHRQQFSLLDEVNASLRANQQKELTIGRVTVWYGHFTDQEIRALERFNVHELSIYYQHSEDLVNLSTACIPSTVRKLEIKCKGETFKSMLPDRVGVPSADISLDERQITLRSLKIHVQYNSDWDLILKGFKDLHVSHELCISLPRSRVKSLSIYNEVGPFDVECESDLASQFAMGQGAENNYPGEDR
jgi:hypothetical protein